MIKANKKHLALSIVALTLALMTTIGITYSWIDDVKLVEFNNDNLAKNGAPLKSGADINSTVVISNTNSSIDLGNILTNDDLTYTYTEGGAEKRHVKYPNTGDDADKTPGTDAINSGKGYFYESGDMHLSPCYSDGETFFFPVEGGGYREGNKDDENVNYISFTAKVSSPDANVDFWFEEVPSVKVAGTATQIANARYSISVDGKSHVYSSTGKANRYNGSAVEEYDVRKTSVYTYNNGENTTADRGANSNTLFSIKKGDTVNMTVKIWLENGTFTNVTASDISFKMVSSWKYTRTIVIEDKTTAKAASSWIGDDSAKMFMTLPSVLQEMNREYKESTDIDNWEILYKKVSYAPFYELTRVGTSYSVTVPLVFNNEKMVLYRCTDKGWNNTGHTSGDDPAQRGPADYKVNCWNWWETFLPNTFKNETYTLYGASYDNVAQERFGGEATNKGYGTWGAAVEIVFDGKTKSVNADGVYGSGGDLATSNGTVFVRDYSDYNASGEIYTYIMYYDSTASTWKTYIPGSSALIQFFGYWDSSHYVYWGYKSWTGDNPQVRPSSSTTYYATQVISTTTISHQGVGFWDGADAVYLIKNGSLIEAATLRSNTFHNAFSTTVTSNATAMVKVSGLSYQTFDVYKDNTSGNSTPAHFYHCKFDNGSTGLGNETSEKVLFPGCYFDWENDRWLGSLGGDIRGGSGDDTGGGGSTSGGGTISGYDIETNFRLKLKDADNNDVTYTVYTNAAGTDFKVKVNLISGNNWTTVLNGSSEYGLENSGHEFNVGSNMDIYLNTSHRNNFSLKTSAAGEYIVTFQYHNNLTTEIKITSVLASS